MHIADRATDDGHAWPSIPGICEATCYSRTAVIDAVKWLDQAGLLAIEKASGRNNRITINLQKVCDELCTIADANVRVRPELLAAIEWLASKGMTRSHGAPGRQAHPSATRTGTAGAPVRQAYPTRPADAPPPVREADYTRPPGAPEPSITIKQPSDNPKGVRRKADAVASEAFLTFWAAYPRKVGKPDALKAFIKIGPSDAVLASMLKAIDAQDLAGRCERGEGKFVPHPATWLNKGRWEDEVVPRQGGLALQSETRPAWATRAGFETRFDAENAGCREHNAYLFRNGQRVEVVA